jgi:hypothetical protein
MARWKLAAGAGALALGAVLFWPQGAGARAVDGSSQQSFLASLEILGGELDSAERQRFFTAVQRHAADLLPADLAGEVPADPRRWGTDHEDLSRRLRVRLAGLDARAVIDAAPTTEAARQGALTAATRLAEQHEAAVIAALRELADAQERAREKKLIDRNRDGVGEYGFFGELAGRSSVRSSKGEPRPLVEPVLPGAYGGVSSGQVELHGYLFKIYLPGPRRSFLAEGGRPDARLAAAHWCCYAWPRLDGVTGRKLFFINQDGVLLVSDNRRHRYEGNFSRPSPRAAFTAGDADIAGRVAVDRVGADGDLWKALGPPAAPALSR